MAWQRYALYWVPSGRLGELGAHWLGRDIASGSITGEGMVDAPDARRYGFHATLKAPFVLTDDTNEAALRDAARSLCAAMAPVTLGLLRVAMLGNFPALRPGDERGIGDVAARLVRGLDRFRAPLAAADLTRRRAAGLSARQEAYLIDWGYPYLFEDFHPHLTLGGPDPEADLLASAERHFAPVLETETTLTHVALVGEDDARTFHLIEQFPLAHTGT